MTSFDHTSYWVTRPGHGELRTCREAISGAEILQAAFSSISSGTERLVGRGDVPAELSGKMACRAMTGTFPFPVKYGYSWVGHRTDGAPVFTMHPHQDQIQVPPEHILPLPSGLPLPRATLIPNLETALNGWWDAETSGEESIIIVGGGIIGALLGFVAWSHRGEPVPLYEVDPTRRATLEELPWLRPVAPDAIAAERYEVAFHCSGSGEGLQWAIDHLGFEGRVVELSWYGMRPVSLQLGTSFHYDRKRIISSQVSTVSRTRRGPDDLRRRTDQVLDLLSNSALDRILGPFIPFTDLPEAMGRLYQGQHLGLHPVVTYT